VSDLHAAIAKVRAAFRGGYHEDLDALAVVCAASERVPGLEQRLAEAEAKAARYDLLQRHEFTHIPGEWTMLTDGIPGVENGGNWPEFATLDEMVDALRHVAAARRNAIPAQQRERRRGLH